ncbi:MAG: SIMPL domain-containing protein [Chloroflexota bacterium]
MAQLRKWLPVAVVTLALLAGCSGVSNVSGATQVHTISVTGTGSTRLPPDLALVTLGVQTQGPDVGEAVDENNRKVTDVIGAIRELGVAAADVATTQFSVSTQQLYDENGQLTGEVTYWVDNLVSVRLRELDKLGQLLQQALSHGANTVQNVTFTVENPEDELDAARLLAIQDARDQAEQLAKAAGVELGEVLTVGEPGYVPVYMEAAVPALAFGEGGGGGYVPTSPGVLEYQVQLSVTYAIR